MHATACCRRQQCDSLESHCLPVFFQQMPWHGESKVARRFFFYFSLMQGIYFNSIWEQEKKPANAPWIACGQCNAVWLGSHLHFSNIPCGILKCYTPHARKALPLSLNASSLLSRSPTDSFQGNCSCPIHPIKNHFPSKWSMFSCNQGCCFHCWWNSACKCTQ